MKAPQVMSVLQRLPDNHTHLQIILFGRLQMQQNGQWLTNSLGQKVAALLAYLACNPGLHARAQLAELFWDDIPPNRYLPNLRSTLSRLPKALKPYIKTTQQSVAFEPTADVWVDVLAFQQLAECLPQSASATPNEQMAYFHGIAEQLQAMQQLYTGEFLDGLTLNDASGFSQWQAMQRSSLARLASDGLHQLTHLYLHQGHYEDGVACARRLIALDPKDEEAKRLLQLLLVRSSDAEEVARQQCGSPQEGGESQWDRDRAAPTEIIGQTITTVESTDMLPPIKLPPLAEPFVGRRAELTALMYELRMPNCRLLTITGLGGIGKTYLAVEAGRMLEQERDFQHGVYFVPLEAIHTGEGIPKAILQALNVVLSGQEEYLTLLCNYLASKKLLLIFDNFEHLITKTDNAQQEQEGSGAPTAPYVATKILAQLLQAAPAIKCVITSRHPLRLQQEQIFPLAGLHYLPPEHPHSLTALLQNDAACLFLQVAERVNRAFQLTDANKEAILRFCQLVQGVPLAIVLGAAQMDFLTPQQLVETYQQNIDILEIDWIDLPERQRSLRALFDYSWQRLDPTLRQIFAQLTIFQGGFTRQAARQIVGVSLLQLRQLYHHSLLQQSAQGRYQIHGLLRQLGAEKLTMLQTETTTSSQISSSASVSKSEQAATQSSQTALAGVWDRHMRFYLTWLAQQRDALQGHQQQQTIASIVLELGNLRLAWQRAVTDQHMLLLAQSLESYYLFHEAQGLYHERLALFTHAIQTIEPIIQQRYHCPQPTAMTHASQQNAPQYLSTYCLLLASLGDCYISLGDAEQAIHYAKTLIACTEFVREDERQREFLYAWSYLIWSRGLSMLGEDRAAQGLADQAIAAAQRAAYQPLIADGLQMRGNTHLLLAEEDAAEDDFQHAYHLYMQSRNLRKAMNSLERLGTIRLWAADVEAAQSYYEQAIAISNQLHDQPTAHRLHLYLARIILRTGAYGQAEQKAQEAQQFFEEIGDRWLLTEVHYFLGKLYWSAGKYQQAHAHFSEALQISRTMNAQRNQIICLARLGVTHKSLGAYQEALELMYEAEALARTLEVDPVRSHILICIAETLYCAGQTMKSIAVYQEALECYAPAELGYQKVEALVGLASVLCHSGKNAAATAHLEELFATVEINLQQLHTMAEPFDTYLKFYRLLEACQDWRAPMVLEEVYALLQSWVAQVDHEQWQRSFLQNIAANRVLIRLYQERETIVRLA